MQGDSGAAAVPRPGIVLGGLVVLAGVVFADLFRGRILFERDVSGLYWGLSESLRRCLASGSLPLWNPWMGFGQPLLANPSAQVLYPWTWLGLLLRPEYGYSVYVIGHYLLALGGVYALGRAARLSPAASGVAGAIFGLSGPLLSYVTLWNHFAGVALLPWVLLAAERTARRPDARRALVWAAVAALQILAGSGDAVLMTVGLEAVVLLRHLSWRTPLARANARLLGAVALATSLALAATALLWLPALDLIRTSMRESLNEGTRTFWSLRPVHLLQFFVPLLPQDLPLKETVRKVLYDGREPLLNSLYLGLASLPLALGAFVGSRRRAALALLLVLSTATAVAMGRNGLAYPALMAAAPGLQVLRYPSKVTIVGALAFAFLVALGFEAWRREPRESRWAWRLVVALPAVVMVAGASAVLLVARDDVSRWVDGPLGPGRLEAVSWPVIAGVVLAAASSGLALLGRRPALMATLAAALAVADLLQANAGLNPTAPASAFVRTPAVVSFLRQDEAARVYVYDYSVRATAAAPVALPQPPATASLPRVWRDALLNQEYPLSLLRYGIRGSFEADPFSLEIAQRRSLWLLLVDSERRPADHLRLLELGGVTHVVARHAGSIDGLALAATVLTPEAGAVRVFRVPHPLSRVYAASGVRVANGPATYGSLLDPAFDLRGEIVLPSGVGHPPTPGFDGDVAVLSDRPDRLQVSARADSAGYLVVLDGYAPGWRARVDGRAAPVLRANAAFRAVPIPAGRHLVDLAYRPRSLWLGLLGTSLGVAAALVLWISTSVLGRPARARSAP